MNLSIINILIFNYYIETLYIVMLLSQMEVFCNSPIKTNKEALIHCPYVRKHKVYSRNLAAHIHSCRKQLSTNYLARFATCKYNSLHIFSIYEISTHQMMCPNRKNIKNIQQQLLGQRKFILQQESSISVVDSEKHQQNDVLIVDICQKNKNKQQKEISDGKPKKRVKLTLLQNQQDSQSYNNQIGQDQEQFQQTKNTQGPFQIKDQELSSVKSQKNEKSIQYDHSDQQIFNQENQKDKIKRSKNDEHNLIKDKQEKYKYSNMEMHQCELCRNILCDSKVKLWKHEKLVKYLKSYNKLEKQHQQIKQYIKVMPSSISSTFLNLEHKQMQKTQIKNTQPSINKNILPQSNICVFHQKNYEKQFKKSYNLQQEAKKTPQKTNIINGKDKQQKKITCELYEKQKLDILNGLSKYKKKSKYQIDKNQQDINLKKNKKNPYSRQQEQINNKLLNYPNNKNKKSSQIFLDQNSIVMDSNPSFENNFDSGERMEEQKKKKAYKNQQKYKQKWMLIND